MKDIDELRALSKKFRAGKVRGIFPEFKAAYVTGISRWRFVFLAFFGLAKRRFDLVKMDNERDLEHESFTVGTVIYITRSRLIQRSVPMGQYSKQALERLRAQLPNWSRSAAGGRPRWMDDKLIRRRWYHTTWDRVRLWWITRRKA